MRIEKHPRLFFVWLEKKNKRMNRIVSSTILLSFSDSVNVDIEKQTINGHQIIAYNMIYIR